MDEDLEVQVITSDTLDDAERKLTQVAPFRDFDYKCSGKFSAQELDEAMRKAYGVGRLGPIKTASALRYAVREYRANMTKPQALTLAHVAERIEDVGIKEMI